MNKKYFTLISLICVIAIDIIMSTALACTPTYKQGHLYIPTLTGSEFSWTLEKISENPLKFSIAEQAIIKNNVDCNPINYDSNFLDIPNVQFQNNRGKTVSNYSIRLKVDMNNKTATTVYYHRIDAIDAKIIRINDRNISSRELMTVFASYFGKPELSFVTAYDLSNIAILVSKTGYFIISKNDWMPPIIAFSEGEPTENNLIASNLVAFDKNIQHNITLGIFPSIDEQQHNKEKWNYIFSLMTTSLKKSHTKIANNISIIEQKSLPLGLWGLTQDSVVDGLIIGNHAASINEYTKYINGKHAYVGCTHLAIARLMNWYQYPKGDVFYTGNQYIDLKKTEVTDSFLHLVSDIGSPRAANSLYTAEGAGMKSYEIVPLFQQADYNAIKSVSGNNTISSVINLYNAIKTEINSSRPALLQMWWDGDIGERIGHAVIITGYKKSTSPLAIGDFYAEIGLGWKKADRYLLLLDNFTFLGFITQTVVNPNVPWGNNINAFSYQLFGGISPKKTTYKLKVNNNAYGNISSDAPFQGKINCGNSNNTCAINFDIKSSVKLTATPNTGYKFVSWSGDCSITLSQSCLVTMDAAKNVTAKFAPITQKPLAIGQSYQGGIIFYLDNTKQHGLIAAPTDFKNVAGAWNVSGAYLINTGWTGIIDSNSQYSFIPPISNCDWQYNFATGHYYDTGISCPYLGVTDTAIGTGQSNTKKIVTTRGNGIYAAKLCDDLVLNGYDDWFLPSLDELNTMYLNIGRGANNSGGFLDNFYWSSSEVSDNSVYKGFGYFGIWLFEDFSIGFQFYGDTGLRNSVRAVRAF